MTSSTYDDTIWRGSVVCLLVMVVLAIVGGPGPVVVLLLLLALAGGVWLMVSDLLSSEDRDESQPGVSTDGRESPATDDALAELRRWYAAGELSEAQFEGRVERLLAAESDTDDARAVLELRYARGELTDTEFDHKLARLDGTQTVERAEREFHIDTRS